MGMLTGGLSHHAAVSCDVYEGVDCYSQIRTQDAAGIS